MRLALSIITTYAIVGFLMYGYAINHKWYALGDGLVYENCKALKGQALDDCNSMMNSEYAKATVSGVFWPVTFVVKGVQLAGHLAVFVTRWP